MISFLFILLLFNIFFVLKSEYYIDNSDHIISMKNGSKSDPFYLFDEAICIFNQKRFLGNLTIVLVSHENTNEGSLFFSKEKIIEIQEGTHVFFQG